MIVVNTEIVPGWRIVKLLGLVQGNTVRSKHFGRDIAAGLKNIVGGELKGYTELLTESRREAVERMLAQARQLGANCVLNVRFSTSSVAAGAAEMYAYGTAAVIEQGGLKVENLIQIGFFLALVLVGLVAGTIAEKRHFAALAKAEAELSNIIVTDLRSLPGAQPGSNLTLVTGEAAISSDYFKTVIAGIKKFIGGELTTYQSLMNRARREAVVRMLRQAQAAGCDAVGNVRLEGVDIAKADGSKGVIMVAIVASGTAYRRA